MSTGEKQARARRARKTRVRIAEQRATRLVVSRSNLHIYAQIIDDGAGRTVAAASTLGKSGANVAAAAEVGKTLAEAAKKAGVTSVVFDRGGFLFHGRVKALADAAREGGLEF